MAAADLLAVEPGDEGVVVVDFKDELVVGIEGGREVDVAADRERVVFAAHVRELGGIVAVAEAEAGAAAGPDALAATVGAGRLDPNDAGLVGGVVVLDAPAAVERGGERGARAEQGGEEMAGHGGRMMHGSSARKREKEVAHHGVSQIAAAAAMKLSKAQLNYVIRQKKGVSASIALRFQYCFGIPGICSSGCKASSTFTKDHLATNLALHQEVNNRMIDRKISESSWR